MGARSIDRYYDRLSECEPLAPEEESRLIRQAQDRDHPDSVEARRRVVESNLRFVVRVARRYRGRGVPLADLIAEGNYGLVKAISYFDDSRGFRFITYAVWWIRHAIQKTLRAHSGAVALPESRVRAHRELKQVRATLRQETGHDPGNETLARELEWTREDVRRARREAQRDQHLEEPITPGGERTIADVLDQRLFPAPDGPIEAESQRGALRAAVSRLGEREATILEKYYGLGRERGRTLGEIAAEYGLSRERIRQLKERGLRRLRDRYEAHELLP